MKQHISESKKEYLIKLGARLRELRCEAGLSLAGLAALVNDEYGAAMTKGMIFKYENGSHEPSAATIYCLGRILNVSPEYIMGETDKRTLFVSEKQGNNAYCLKLYTSMTSEGCGVSDESVTVLIPDEWLSEGRRFFAYRISGRRFAPRYLDGDILIFQQGSKTRPEQTALVSIAGEEAELCFVTRRRGGKDIMPIDPTLEGRFYTTDELNALSVEVLGTCVQLQRQEFEL